MDCGACVRTGRAGCQAVFYEIAALAYRDPSYGRLHNLVVDAYCMQHVETYCKSAKSYAAHLARLCCGIEFQGNREAYAAIQQWLDGAVSLEKPQTLSYVGNLTIIDVRAARSAQEHSRLVHNWSQNVWEAYTEQHELARTWVRQALGR